MKRATLVEWARTWEFGVDVARREIRRLPELQQLGEVFGPVKVYTAAEAEQIRRAVAERPTAKRAGAQELVS